VKKLLESVGMRPVGDQRGQMDVVGFAVNAGQMDEVVRQAEKYAAARREQLRRDGLDDEKAFFAAVCPHDDYYYASRLYALLIPHIRAKTVVIFGVFHKARVFGCRDVLVFDDFKTWHGPYGKVRVSPIREQIIAALPKDSYVLDDDMQTVEHSVEAIVPWLQAYRRDVEIVSILVPYMGWQRMDELAEQTAEALAETVRRNGLRLGKDLAIVCSADAVHYGDVGWGGKNYAPFGTDVEGYSKAVERDLELAKLLCGPFRGDSGRGKLKEFLYTCVDSLDVTQYKVTWCGRFSVPFGLDVASRLKLALGRGPLVGRLLDYGTSVSEASLDLDKIPGLGTTAPNNLHHFVGYAAIGYE